MLGTKLGPELRQYGIVITVNFSILWCGMALGWTSSALAKLFDDNETVLDAPLSISDASWIASSTLLVSIFVGPTSSFLLNNLGRKYSVILSSIPHIIGCLIILFAKKVWLLILARVFVGVSLAWSFNVAPNYVAEIASKDIRGSLGSILQITCCIGSAAMLAIGPFVSYMTLNLMYTSIVVLTAIPMWFLPESPYFLYSKGHTDKATEILIKIRGSELLAKQEISEYEVSNSETKLGKLSLFKDSIFLKTLAIAIVFAAFVQLTAANLVEVYLQSLLPSLRTIVKPEIASIVIMLIKLAGSVHTAIFSDRFGRKPILICSYIGMAVGMVGFGLYYHISRVTKGSHTFIDYISLVCLVLTVFCNSFGQVSIFYPMIAELFDGPSRALGTSVAYFIGFAFAFIVAKCFFPFVTLVGPAIAHWSFGLICILAAVFVWFCLPETKGKSFAEIQGMLGRKT